MIKRTRSESVRVAQLVHRTPTPYVECRAEGRHALGKRVIAVHLVPGERDATVRRTCRECGTVRVERFRVRVNRDRATLVFLERHGTPQYRHPTDYTIDQYEPRVTRLDWLGEAVNRDARGGGAEVVELRPAAAG
jgi:hypothetical protein